MKVATNVPQAIQVPVYVTQTQYEIWYAKPLSLGKIDYRGNYWYTADGGRFASSRDAMRYLIRLYEATGKVQVAAPGDPAVPAPDLGGDRVAKAKSVPRSAEQKAKAAKAKAASRARAREKAREAAAAAEAARKQVQPPVQQEQHDLGTAAIFEEILELLRGVASRPPKAGRGIDRDSKHS